VPASGRASRERAPTPTPFEPWGATTDIGSLPHTDVDEALDLVAATCPEVPYWPQLPRTGRRERPLVQALGSAAALVRDEGGLLVCESGEDELVERLSGTGAGEPPGPGRGRRPRAPAPEGRRRPRRVGAPCPPTGARPSR
jgi:hypothetical protein